MEIKTFFCLIGLFVFCGCGDDEMPPEVPVELIFEGVQMFDVNGSSIGCYNNCGNDWTSFGLTPEELAYLNFPDTINLAGAGNNSSTNRFYAFPNPIPNSGNMSVGAAGSGTSKLKIAVINKKGETKLSNSFLLFSGSNNFVLSSALFASFERKTLHRMYYAIYNEDNDILYSGYGDISVCESESNHTTETCFN